MFIPESSLMITDEQNYDFKTPFIQSCDVSLVNVKKANKKLMNKSLSMIFLNKIDNNNNTHMHTQIKYSITFCKIQHFKLIGLKDIMTNTDIFLPVGS